MRAGTFIWQVLPPPWAPRLKVGRAIIASSGPLFITAESLARSMSIQGNKRRYRTKNVHFRATPWGIYRDRKKQRISVKSLKKPAIALAQVSTEPKSSSLPCTRQRRARTTSRQQSDDAKLSSPERGPRRAKASWVKLVSTTRFSGAYRRLLLPFFRGIAVARPRASRLPK